MMGKDMPGDFMIHERRAIDIYRRLRISIAERHCNISGVSSAVVRELEREGRKRS